MRRGLSVARRARHAEGLWEGGGEGGDGLGGPVGGRASGVCRDKGK